MSKFKIGEKYYYGWDNRNIHFVGVYKGVTGEAMNHMFENSKGKIKMGLH